MRNLILFAFFFVITLFVNAQTDSCKVLHDKIRGKYTGECLNGLANGKGESIGEDTYIGTFKDGFPDGEGKYIFKNGDLFIGNWIKGKRNGKGKLETSINAKKKTLKGYWKEDKYVGTSNPDVPYVVTNSSSSIEYTVEKNRSANESGNEITLLIVSPFTFDFPTDLKIDKSSGLVTQIGKKIYIRQYTCPIHCEISYSIMIGTRLDQCSFIIDIYEKGKFTICLNNT